MRYLTDATFDRDRLIRHAHYLGCGFLKNFEAQKMKFIPKKWNHCLKGGKCIYVLCVSNIVYIK
jgi:hypothetical protein